MRLEWMDLRVLTQYAAVSERTVREWIHRVEDPLPAAQVGSKILVSRTKFDRWLEAHPMKSFGGGDIGSIVDEVLAGVTN